MNFESRVGNTLALSRLAMKVYSSLIVAPDDLKKVSGQVWSLQAILKLLHETEKNMTLSDGDEEQLNNLAQGCCKILSELETIINQSQSVTKQRFSRTVNYTVVAFADNSELQQKLVLQLSLLTNFQMGLANRAQVRIEHALQTISKAIRVGQRSGSILEATAICNEVEDMDTIWFRIESELEGEGVEKSDIAINKGYIHSWIQVALASGNLDKATSADAASDQDIQRN